MAESRIRSKADVIKEQKCEACGGSLVFDPKSGKLVCEYCGTVYEIEAETGGEAAAPEAGAAIPAAAGSAAAQGAGGAAAQAPGQPAQAPAGSGQAPQIPSGSVKTEVEGFNFHELNDVVTDENAEDLPVYNCRSCGAEIIAPPSQIALTCPYCGNNIVLTEKVSGKLRPNGVLPFKIVPKDLPDAMKRFYRGKVLLPKNFFSESTMGHVTGVYVPFWTFSGGVNGTMQYVGDTVTNSVVGNYRITETKEYAIDRDVSVSFDNVPVDASGRIEDKLMDSLEPFDMKEMKPFDMRYLAGFTADRFDVAKNDIAKRARDRMTSSVSNIAKAQVGGYTNVRSLGGRLNFNIDAKYLLFPVYLFDITHENKAYHFAVNGQTGKVVGEIPTDKKVSLAYFAKRAAAVAAAVLAFAIVKYLGGR